MSAAEERDTSGTWRNYQFVLWTDVFVPLKATVYLFLIVMVGVVVVTPLMAQQGVSALQLRGEMLAFTRSPLGVQLATAINDLVLLFFIWRIARRVSAGSFVARYRRTEWLAIAGAAVGGVVLCAAMLYAVSQLEQQHLVEFHTKANERFFMPGGMLQYPVVIATVGIIAPFVEEFYFRGVLLSWLNRKISVVPAIVVSAALFGLAHLRFLSHPGAEGWVLTGIIATLGLVNAVLAVGTRSLWPSFALHASYNLSLVGLALLGSAS